MIVECEEACATTSLMNFYSLDARLYKPSWASTMEKKIIIISKFAFKARFVAQIDATRSCVSFSLIRNMRNRVWVLCVRKMKNCRTSFFSPSHSLLMKNYVNSHPIHLWKLIKKKMLIKIASSHSLKNCTMQKKKNCANVHWWLSWITKALYLRWHRSTRLDRFFFTSATTVITGSKAYHYRGIKDCASLYDISLNRR